MHFDKPLAPHFLLAATLAACLATLPASAATYQKIDGSIVGPIQYTAAVGGGPHSYSGNDLAPTASLHSAALAYADLIAAALAYTDLAGADLAGADLTGANLTNAILTHSVLAGANLTGADLTDADLGGANLAYAVLFGADLTGADLTSREGQDADLTRANLTYADLSGADLTSANLGNTSLNYATFRTDTALHDGQTVAQHGFDTTSLELYLEGPAVGAWKADNLTIVVPIPSAMWMAMPLLSVLGVVTWIRQRT